MMGLVDDILGFIFKGGPVGGSASTPLGTLYTTPAPPVGISESRDLAHCHPEFQRRYGPLKADFERQTGKQLFETCTWRSKEKQGELYKVGRRGIAGERTLTQLDGTTMKSRHNVFPAEAVDVCVDSDPGPGKHPVWNKVAYLPLGPLCEKYGLTWGGNWRIDDYPHIELPAGFA